MQYIINLGNKKTAVSTLALFSLKKMDVEIKITNAHIAEINKILKQKVFKKDALFVNSETLWEIMQPTGKKANIIIMVFLPKKYTRPYLLFVFQRM